MSGESARTGSASSIATKTIAIRMFLLRSRFSTIVRRCPTPTGSRQPTRSTSPRRSVYALRYQGHWRVHNADEIMAEIAAKRLVEHLERTGFVVIKRPAIGGGAALGRGREG